MGRRGYLKIGGEKRTDLTYITGDRDRETFSCIRIIIVTKYPLKTAA